MSGFPRQKLFVARARGGNSRGWRAIPGGVTAAQGYLASGVAAGIKKVGPDLALVFSTQPSIACAVFTCNQVQAAPVLLSMQHIARSRGRIRAILLIRDAPTPA